MKQAAKRVTGLLAACALLVALVPGTIWAAAGESETSPGTSINEIQGGGLPAGAAGSENSENLPEGAPSGGDGRPITVPEPAEPEEPEAETPGAPPEDEDGLPGDTPEPSSDAPESEPEELEPEDDPAPLVRPAGGLIMPTALTDDLAVGTWAGTDSKPGNGHRWVEFGGILWRVLEVYEYDAANGDEIASGANSGDRIAFLLAEDLLPETMPFDSGDSNNWNGSSIWAWLNDDNAGFLSGFNAEQRGAIVESSYAYGGSNTGHDNTGSSQVFLLSVDEASNPKYFANDGDRVAYLNNNSSRWWLRSPGYFADFAALVSNNGAVDPDGLIVRIDIGIRPALKINLASDIFTSALYGISATVQNSNGKAINGAEVTLAGGAIAPASIFTSTLGYAALDTRVEGGSAYTLRVTKFGYEPYEVQVTPGSASTHVTVTLNEDGTLPPYVLFGEYSGTPLEWQVLDIDDSTPGQPLALLLAESGLYAGNWAAVNTWLNDNSAGFLKVNDYFSALEQAAMLEYAAAGDNKVFLLSKDEVEEYLPQENMRLYANRLHSNNRWWLRSGGSGSYDTVEATTGAFSTILSTGSSDARPAVWVDLTKLYQHEDDSGNVTLVPVDTHTATVTVVDGGNSNAAIPDATVVIEVDTTGLQPGETLRPWNGTQATTDTGGQATFALPDGDHTITATAPGYTQGSDTLTISGGNENITITLNSIPTVQNLAYTGTGTAGEVVITFSEAMDTSQGAVAFTGGAFTLDTGTWNSPANTVYTAAYSGLDYNTQYTIEVSGFKSANDAEMEPYNTGPFTTPKGDLSGASITVNGEPFIYIGSAHTPGVTVTLGSNTLTLNTDYTLSFSNNTNAGTATVTATGINDYESEKSTTFTIAKANPAVTWPTSATLTYGQTLAEAVLTGQSGAGEFAFVLSDFAPTVANSGTQYEMAFTPADTANYNTPANQNATVTVQKSDALAVSAHPTATAKEGVAKGFTFDLSSIALNKGDTGALNYSAAIGTDANNIVSSVSVNGSTLSYSIAGTTAAGNTATIIITISTDNYVDATATLTITITEKDPQTITFAQGTLTKTYGDASFTEAASPQGAGGVGAITYESSDPTVATVNSATGEVTIVKAGTATITATKAADDEYAEAKAYYTLIVAPKTVVVRVEDMEIQQGAALPTPRVTYTGFVGADDDTNTLATPAVAAALPGDSSKAGTWTVGFETEAVLNNTTGTNYTLEHKPGTLTITEKPTEPTKPTEPDKQPDPITFEALPENNTVRVGEKFILTPTEDGQTGSTGWSWDSEFFSATFNSPATFTALKAGTSTITYTAPDGRVASVTITIQAASDSGTGGSAITATGDSSRMGLYLTLAALAMASIGGLAYTKRRRRPDNG